MPDRTNEMERIYPNYVAWAYLQGVSHGKLSDLPGYAKERAEANYWKQRGVITQ